MNLHRRELLCLATAAAVLPTTSRIVSAQTYPTFPVRLLLGFPAGGSADVVMRPIVQRLAERLGQPVVLEHRPGASTNIATEAVVRAPADGHMLLFVTGANAISATLHGKLNFNFLHDIAPIASLIRLPFVMIVNPSVPAKTVPELIAYAKANPGKLTMASGGVGTPSHVSGELFKMMTGVTMLHVPYRGAAPAVTDLLAGHVQVYFDPMPNSMGHIRAGKVRPLAVTSAKRSNLLPDIPAVGDFVAGYEASFVFGVGAPKNTPAGIVDKLNKEINACLAEPKISAHLAAMGGMVLAGSPAEFGKILSDETEKWAKVIKFAGIRPE